MLRLAFHSSLILTCLTSVLQAEDYLWSLELFKLRGLHVYGNLQGASGVVGDSVVLDGSSLLKVRDSDGLAGGDNGFTFVAWVNPYRLGHQQQIIAAKNRYSLDERQWGVMIDRDSLFRLYVWQDQWLTVGCSIAPKPGMWHLIAVVVRPKNVELWVNGELSGQAKLEKPIPQTKAPLTFGGVDDNGRIWQNFAGAIDEVQLFDRPLVPSELAAAYRAVSTSHEVPTSFGRTIEVMEPAIDGISLWGDSNAVPKVAELAGVEGTEFFVIKPYEFHRDGYRFLHGVALAWHQGKLYASFGHNQGGENTDTEEARFMVSEDEGRNWSRVRTMDAGKALHGVSHGVFLSCQGKLWAFHAAYSGILKGVHTRAYLLDELTGKWQSLGTVIEGGFWPMTEPVKMGDGNWIMPGMRVGNGTPAAVAISHGDDLKKWDLVVIPRSNHLGTMWGESTVIVDGANVVNIARYGQKARALAARSGDYGRTWTSMTETDLPMVTSKPCAGTLSTGQRYLIGTTTADSGKRRSPLTIAVTQPGEMKFSKVFVIRDANFPTGPGESHPDASLAYPYAIEHEGKLYIGYSNNGANVGRVGKGRSLWNNNSAELAVIPIGSLDAGEARVEGSK
ncbi:MAG: exo-alpha-sialidase [Pirellulaceae bacterium]|nr:exo-alpha-sialidase [Pirellulaceae bacterium]